MHNARMQYSEEASPELVMVGPMAPVLRDIVLKREDQRIEFYRTDDALTPPEWIARLAKHLGRAVSHDPEVFRQQLVIVAALALAGIEAHDRRSQT